MNLNRYRMNIPNGDYPYGKCASWIGGGGIFLGLASISYFGRGIEHLINRLYEAKFCTDLYQLK